jgi:hypothetical protein
MTKKRIDNHLVTALLITFLCHDNYLPILVAVCESDAPGPPVEAP